MRVSIVLPYPASHAVGGFLVHYELANHLAHGGDVPTIAHARSFRRPKWRLLLNYGASFVTMRPKTMAPWFQFDGRVRLRIVPWLKSVFLPKADVTLLTAYETAEAMGPRTRRTGPLVQIVYDYEFWAGGDPSEREKIASALGRPDVYHISTSGAVGDMLRAIGVPVVATVPPGVSSRFACHVPSSERALMIGFGYREEPHKGMTELFCALESVHEAYPEVGVQCFGWVGETRLPPWVESLGYLADADLVAFYNRCAVFVLPSYFEGWGLPVAEAMACGAAVVTTYCGGTEDFARHEENALLVRPRDEAALSQAIVRLLQDAGLREKLSTAAVDSVGHMTWEVAAERTRQVLRRVVQSEAR